MTEAFIPPATVGIPPANSPNAFAALNDTSSVDSTVRQGEDLRSLACIAAREYENIQALLDNRSVIFSAQIPPQ